MFKACSLLVTLVVCIAFSETSYGKTYDAVDVLTYTRVESVVASPNGKQVAFVTMKATKTQPSQWQYTLNLKAGKKTIIITQGDYIGSIEWSPDGKSIAYVVVQGNQQSIGIYALNQAKAFSLVVLSRGVDNLKWSPSGQQIAFVADAKTSPVAPNGLMNPAKRIVNSQLYLTNTVLSGASFKPITPATISISESVFDGGFSFAPNGKEIAFAYQPSARSTDTLKSKIAILNVNTGDFEPLAFCDTHTCNQPFYSPDGKWLAFAASIPSSGKAKSLLEDIDIQNQIWVMNQASQQIHCLQNTYNGNPYLLGWESNSQGVFVADMYKTQGPQIYQLSLASDAPVKLISNQQGFIEPLTLSLNNSGTLFGFSYETINTAPEAYTASTNDFGLNQITSLNTAFNKPLGQVRVLNWASKDGTPIEGLLITPAHYNPKYPHPLYIDIHGGPSGTQFQRYLGGCDEYAGALPPTTCVGNILHLGYVILQVNYRGSNGYGVDFRVKNFADFGGGDFNDVMSGVDNLLQQGIADSNKMIITGWSYGGYLAAWAITQTNRFAAAIDGDGFTDFISYTGTSDDHDFFYRYLGAYYWQGAHNLYWERSPISKTQQVQTPLLILQGGQDNRVPLSQAQELYSALNIQNKPVTMLVAPNQAHEPSDPDTIAKEIDAINAWLKSH